MSASTALYDVTVTLTGTETYFYILGRITGALRMAGATEDSIREFREEATTGDLEHLLQTARQWVTLA